MEVQVTFKGADLNSLRTQANAFFKSSATVEPKSTTLPMTTKKKAAPVVEDEEELDLLADDEASEDTEELDFDTEEIEDEPASKKTAKAKEITEKQVQDAAKAHAAKHGRKVTLNILEKKFKVKTVGELTAKQYPAVIAALKA